MDHLPPAPTPPVNNGGMPSNADRTANLLNLLKFSGNNAHQQKQAQQQQQLSAAPAPQAQTQPQPPSQAMPDGPSPQPEMQQFDDQASQHSHQSQSQAKNQQRPAQYENPQSPPFSYNQVHQQPLSGLPQHQYPTLIHQPAPAGADPSGLLAALMRGAHEAEDSPKPPPAQLAAAPQPPQPTNFSGDAPSADTTSYLLNLLNRPKPSQTEQPLLTETSRSANLTPQSPASQTNDPPLRSYGEEAYSMAEKYQQAQAQIFANQQKSQNGPTYNHSQAQEPNDESRSYQQLMGLLNHRSPEESSSNHQSTHSQGFKNDLASPQGSQGYGQHHSPVMSPPHMRSTMDRTSSHHSQHSHPSHHSAKHPGSSGLHDQYEPEENTETVAEAVEGISHSVDHDANRAIAHAEHAQIYTVEPQDEVLETDQDYDSADRQAGNLDPAADGVVDSWESADQDEIVVIEEKIDPPIKVYNFPMKPFISINLQDDPPYKRPEFRHQSVMDIARLKKEFDQMDRNLYTASQRYMTYGMSKQGGMRVIRQDDGKDAKIFTDTKDRIFNLAISATPEDSDVMPNEAIIGTGVSGTVYWVQVKDGIKDHIDDTHLEQYGFALPPISSQEGDAPGGVLKTRARASTAHPEYFAVGRGKSISIVWPQYIMQNNLFKPGHDRVVDTEALQKQCSLKINTGKAGKDFTFSQDDTVVVSLDKSGRVKFWDVRDLTAATNGSDPRYPMPAQSNLEVKEPLMTLASTPEGEKAWPTSVLLLDKQRPYQKQCALRYMIVGMKQNHTLQLWDLALGKPVQEFNLPHSKESDAVCSVMYHPASGMIVIGHPTRNSVYFAHLSAPKYNLKSVSQAEYIQRLVAQDTSIPQPDSTAVISGVREYSFGSRGILRSLDLLATPAMDQDADEATLFELYAMHSKGVLCLLVRQPELGWNKDNKVMDAVDAVGEGVVVVSKLKSPQPPEPNETIRPAPQKEIKELAKLEGPVDTPRNIDVPQVKVKHEIREPDAPTPQPTKETQPEKPDRKSRKKKTGAANQTDAAATNGINSRNLSKDSSKDSVAGFSNETVEAALAGVEMRLAATVDDSVTSALKAMQAKLDQGAETREAIYEENQKQLLGMVSEVLNENVQTVLGSLIHAQFNDMVVPVISTRTNQAVSELIEKVQPQLANSAVKEVQKSLPQSISYALRNKETTNAIAERVSESVAISVQQNVLAAIMQQLTPMVSNVVSQNTQRFMGDINQTYRDQFDQMKAQHVADAQKIDQLMSHITRLTEMVGTMAQTQTQMQADFLKLKQQPSVAELPAVGSAGNMPPHEASNQSYANNAAPKASNNNSSNYSGGQAPTHAGPYMGSPQYSRGHQNITSPRGSAPSEPVNNNSIANMAASYNPQSQEKDPQAEQELQQQIRRIEQLIQDNALQDAMLHWIQSGHEEEIFKRCLARYPPAKFAGLPLIMLLVVIATISKNIKPSRGLKEEIDWIDMAVKAFGENMMNYVSRRQTLNIPLPRTIFALTTDNLRMLADAQQRDYDQGQDFGEVVKSTTQTLQLLNSRLQPLLNHLRNEFPTDPFLLALDRSKMEWIIQSSQHILQSLQNRYE